MENRSPENQVSILVKEYVDLLNMGQQKTKKVENRRVGNMLSLLMAIRAFKMSGVKLPAGYEPIFSSFNDEEFFNFIIDNHIKGK
jgi:hypothetical protein